MLERFRQKGDTRWCAKARKSPGHSYGRNTGRLFALRDKEYKSGESVRPTDMKSVISGIFIPSWLASEYSLREKINLWRGRSFRAASACGT